MELQTQNTALQAWRPPKLEPAKVSQSMLAAVSNWGIEITKTPNMEFVQWLANRMPNGELGQLKKEGGAYMQSVISDLRWVSESIYKYKLDEEHTMTFILELADMVFALAPKLTYNKTRLETNVAMQVAGGIRHIDIYEQGEVVLAFRAAARGFLNYKLVTEHANSRLNTQVLREVLEAYETYRRIAKQAIFDAQEAEAKAIRDKEQTERNKRINANFWPETWAKVNEKCDWEHIDDVHAFFYTGWIDEHKLHEFSNDEKNAAYEIGKTLIFNKAKVTKSDPQAKPSEIGLSERIIQLMGEPESIDDKARAKAMGQRVMLYLHFTGRNPLDEPLTNPKKK